MRQNAGDWKWTIKDRVSFINVSLIKYIIPDDGVFVVYMVDDSEEYPMRIDEQSFNTIQES